MIKKIFSIRDIKAAVYNLPFYRDSQIEAIRHLKMAMITQPDMMINQFPKDYTLFEIGEWEDILGTIEMHPDKKFVADLHQIAEEIETEKTWKEVIREQVKQDMEEKNKKQ